MRCETEHGARLGGDGITVTVPLPTGAGEPRPVAIGTDGVPGGRQVLGASWVLGGAAELRLGCLRAPVPAWVAGLERTMLDGATARVRTLGGLDALHPGELTVVAGHWEQPYSGEGAARAVVGRHLLGFVGPEPEAMLCSLACFYPGGAVDACGGAVARARFEAAWQPAPAPGIWGRLLELAVARPAAAATICAAAVLLVVVLILRFRPRPRR